MDLCIDYDMPEAFAVDSFIRNPEPNTKPTISEDIASQARVSGEILDNPAVDRNRDYAMTRETFDWGVDSVTPYLVYERGCGP